MLLKDYLLKEGISIAQLAYYMNRHPNHISRIIKRIQRPSMSLAERIIEFTNGQVTLDEILPEKPQYCKCPHCGQDMQNDRVRQYVKRELPDMTLSEKYKAKLTKSYPLFDASPIRSSDK